MNYVAEYPWLVLLPPFISIGLALITRNVIFSLTAGILVGSSLVTNTILSTDSVQYVWEAFSKGFFDQGLLVWQNISLLMFLWVLGVLVYTMQHSGHIQAFSGLLINKLKTKRGGQLFALFLGGLLFIDDYFKILAIGSIARPFFDRLKISRAKLAYFLDVTAAPVCVLIPISSWGAAIIATLSTTIVNQNIPDYNGFTLFIQIATCNWYPILSLLFVFLVTYLGFDFKRMKRSEETQHQHKEAHHLPEVKIKDAFYFILPIGVLTLVTLVLLIGTGIIALEGQSISLLKVIAEGKMNLSMLLGGILAVGVTFLLRKKKVNLFTSMHKGFLTMFPSMLILTFAWALLKVMTDLKTGTYLASFVQGNPHLSLNYLPFFMFFIGGIMAFSTGTSWGTFGIMLPIAAEIAMQGDPGLLVPLMAASIGGAIFGDHASPISDTSILSSTGAQCKHMEHFTTQLPYALFVAFVTLGGYLIFGFTQSLLISFLLCTFILIVCSLVFSKVYSSKNQ